jgi:hypothetical protein
MLLQKSFKEPFLGKCFLGPSMNAETAAIWYHILSTTRKSNQVRPILHESRKTKEKSQ